LKKRSPGARVSEEGVELEAFTFPRRAPSVENVDTPSQSQEEDSNFTPLKFQARKDSDGILNVKFEDRGKRFTIIGLCEECRTFETVQQLWTHIKDVYSSRYEILLRRFSDPDLVLNHLQEFHYLAPFVEPLWIDVQEPSEEDMIVLQEHFGLHPITVQDCLTDKGSGEKWEHFNEYLSIVLSAMPVELTNKLSSSKITETALSTRGLSRLNLILFDVICLQI
jgi:Mg2+ and Co2+ transporter CorA